MVSGSVWMLKWRSESSGTRVVSQPHADLRDRGGAPASALSGRRRALPEDARGSREGRSGGGPRGREGAAADPRSSGDRPAGEPWAGVRLGAVQRLARGAPPRRARHLLRDRRAQGARAGGRPADVARAGDVAPPAGPRGASGADLPRPQDPRPRALSLLRMTGGSRPRTHRVSRPSG